MKTKLPTLALLTAAVAFALLLSPRARATDPGTFDVYGAELISTTAPLGIVAAARNEVHDTLAHWIKDNAGRTSDPTFSEGGRSWTQSTPGQPETIAATRSKTEFTDADGHHIRIEVISAKNAPTLVFLSSEGAKDPMAITNAFLAALQKQGVKMTGK